MLAAAAVAGIATAHQRLARGDTLALPSIVVTIGTLSLYRGLAQVVLGDQAITGYPERLSTWGNGTLGDLVDRPGLIVPIEFGVWLVAAVAVGLLLHRTVHGRRLYAIGANRIASRFSGISVDRYRFALFVFSGLMAALAAVLLTGRIGSTRPNLAFGWELEAVTIRSRGMPAGAIPEGWSPAGVTMATALLSMLTDKCVREVWR